jgi:hypothetical protein
MDRAVEIAINTVINVYTQRRQSLRDFEHLAGKNLVDKIDHILSTRSEEEREEYRALIKSLAANKEIEFLL